jgi:hypothetical protein
MFFSILPSAINSTVLKAEADTVFMIMLLLLLLLLL